MSDSDDSNSGRKLSSKIAQNAAASMIIERDVPIGMPDGIVLRADIFRPRTSVKVPVIMNLGPYCKGVPFQEGYAEAWKKLIADHPEILEGSTGSFLTWETVDPERWVPNNYAVVRVDSRGAGRSQGRMDLFSETEARDYYNCIEWAAAQPWSNGRVGLLGISYYAINQWNVASLQPPHLTAMIPWEGASDHYREATHHGGIFSNRFFDSWYPARVLMRQHGKGKNGEWDPWLNEPATGPETLTEDELRSNREDYLMNNRNHNLDDGYHRSRSPNFAKITVPLLSASNWGGLGLHSRGNFEGYLEAASKQKWLEVHGGGHEEWFYLPYGLEIQKRFFEHFLKGIENGWNKEPKVLLNIRHIDRFELRKETEWPIPRTKWTNIYLNPIDKSLSWVAPTVAESKVAVDSDSAGITFTSPPLEHATELTGPLAAKLEISSSTTDADLFLTLRAFDIDGKDVVFKGASDPKIPLSQGWLRASHRKLDQSKSKSYRPYHTHDQIQKLAPNNIYGLDIEIWPTCVVLPAGYRIGLTVQGRDFTWTGREDVFQGSGSFLHNDKQDRPDTEYKGVTTIYSRAQNPSYVLLPIIPN